MRTFWRNQSSFVKYKNLIKQVDTLILTMASLHIGFQIAVFINSQNHTALFAIVVTAILYMVVHTITERRLLTYRKRLHRQLNAVQGHFSEISSNLSKMIGLLSRGSTMTVDEATYLTNLSFLLPTNWERSFPGEKFMLTIVNQINTEIKELREKGLNYDRLQGQLLILDGFIQSQRLKVVQADLNLNYL